MKNKIKRDLKIRCEKEASGVVTVMFSLVLGVIISLMVTLIYSVRTEAARLLVFDSASLSLNSLFAEYETELLEKYGLLLLCGGEKECIDKEYLASKLKGYMEYGIEPDKDMYLSSNYDLVGINLLDVSVDSVITPADSPEIFMTMVNDYAATEELMELAGTLLGFEERNKTNEKITKVLDDITDCYEKEAKIDMFYLTLVKKIDGICSDGAGIDFNNPTRASAFAKSFMAAIPFEVTRQTISISDDRVYPLIAGYVTDIRLLYENIYEAKRKMDSGEQSQLVSQMALEAFVRTLRGVLGLAYGATQDAVEIMGYIDLYKGDLSEKISKLKDSIDAIFSEVDFDEYEEIYNEFMEFLEEFEKMMERLEGLSGIKDILDNNMEAIRKALEYCDNGEYYESFEAIMSYRTDSMYMDYSDIPQVTSSQNDELASELADFAGGSILKYVLPPGTKVSGATVSFGDLASTKTVMADEDFGIENALKKAVFCAYLSDTFTCYEDFVDDADINTQNGGIPIYELEYILSGLNSDRANLTVALGEIYGVRFSADLVHVVLDSEKRQEALALAMALVGFTVVAPAVKAMQYVILTAWAMGEAIIDIKRLMAGERVHLVKTKADWKLSLENLVAGSFSYVTTGKLNQGIGKITDGLNYKEYLSLLILAKSTEKITYRTMDLIELHMIYLGVPEFRMRNYIYGMSVSVKYELRGSDIEQVEKCSFIY